MRTLTSWRIRCELGTGSGWRGIMHRTFLDCLKGVTLVQTLQRVKGFRDLFTKSIRN